MTWWFRCGVGPKPLKGQLRFDAINQVRHLACSFLNADLWKMNLNKPKYVNDTPNTQFLLAEYHEAATSYANGVEIGFSTIKAFLAINGVLITLHQTPLELVNNSEVIQYLQQLAPYFGILLSFILVPFVSLYFKHLNNCLHRCCDIEEIFEGKLFSGNRDVSKTILNTKNILFFIAIVPGIMWVYSIYLSLS